MSSGEEKTLCLMQVFDFQTNFILLLIDFIPGICKEQQIRHTSS